MNYKYLGNTGVQVSGLCFGTMSFGGDADEDTSRAMFERCREAGINFFDCANVYSGGRAEEILGRLMAGHREELVITSKIYFPMGEDRNQRGSTRKHIRHALEASLRRLNTDYLDVYFLHHFDETTPIEETLRAMEDVVRSGQVLYIGASNFAAWQVEKALGISARNGWARFEVLQPMYNLIKRQAEVEILPMAMAENLAVIPYSPLGGGLLSGKYGSGVRPETGRLISNQMYIQRYGDEWVFETAGRFSDFARKAGYKPATLAVAWAASHPGVTAPIIGARNLAQLQDSLEAVDFVMTPGMRAEVSAFSPEPALATDRSEER
jgi:aryl-alcohol dehydrogenase-like predicted oxidoreductase